MFLQVFRHGNRNPTEGSIWDGNSYNNASFYPEGYGQLTNVGSSIIFLPDNSFVIVVYLERETDRIQVGKIVEGTIRFPIGRHLEH